MGNNLTEKGAKAAALRAEKRAAALRENLKRRKSVAAQAGDMKGRGNDAKSESGE